MLLQRIAASAVLLAAAGFGPTHAEEVILKVHHFLPATAPAHTRFMQPWCERIAKQSKDRLKCQIYPAMQLGGTPAQLYDQVKDGVADVVWTIPSYSAGRFPLIEVFELPFMSRDAAATSKALWEYVQQYDKSEFADVKPLAFHVHGGGVFHMVKKPIVTRGDLRGLKVRAPTRQTNKLIAVLGGTPVGMPASQIPEALSKGVIDGALVPYEVVPAIKANELAKFHSEPDSSQPAIYTTAFIFAMNRAKYDSLPADLKKVIDANSGLEFSAEVARAFGQADLVGRKLIAADRINIIAASEIESWKKAAQPVIDGWVKEVSDKGADGKALLEGARALLAKHTK
jgi:TRAP-type C4-dicarboxylate transport system substrate-binding protein